MTIFGGPAVVLGALALNDGKLGGAVEAQAAVTVGPNFDGGTGTLSITGAAARTITFASGTNLLNVNLNAPNVTLQPSGSGTLNWQALTFQSGTINQGSVDFVFTSPFTNYDQSGGIFNGSTNAVTFSNQFRQSGGAFNGGSGNLDVKGALTLTGGTFNSTTGTLFVGASFFDDVGGIFKHNGGGGSFFGTGGEKKMAPARGGVHQIKLNFIIGAIK